MPTTLDTMYQKCAMFTDMKIEKTNGEYQGDSLTTVNKFKEGINYAYIKVAKEKWKPRHKENVVLDSNLQFSTSSLTKTYNGINRIEDENGYEIDWKHVEDTVIECPDNSEGDTVTVYYYYIPDEMTDLSDTPVIPESVVDPKIYCYLGAYFYFAIDDDDKAAIWLNLFNEGFDKISTYRGEVKQVKDVYGWW